MFHTMINPSDSLDAALRHYAVSRPAPAPREAVAMALKTGIADPKANRFIFSLLYESSLDELIMLVEDGLTTTSILKELALRALPEGHPNRPHLEAW